MTLQPNVRSIKMLQKVPWLHQPCAAVCSSLRHMIACPCAHTTLKQPSSYYSLHVSNEFCSTEAASSHVLSCASGLLFRQHFCPTSIQTGVRRDLETSSGHEWITEQQRQSKWQCIFPSLALFEAADCSIVSDQIALHTSADRQVPKEFGSLFPFITLQELMAQPETR